MRRAAAAEKAEGLLWLGLQPQAPGIKRRYSK